MIQHNESPLSTWIPEEYELNRTYGWDKAAFSPYLTALRQEHLNSLRQHPGDADALRESWKRYQRGYDRTEEVQHEKDWSL